MQSSLLQSEHKKPASQYVELRLPDGKLACRFDPIRGLLEVQSRGIKHYFDLTQVIQTIDNSKEVC
jgi:hypothetical protein